MGSPSGKAKGLYLTSYFTKTKTEAPVPKTPAPTPPKTPAVVPPGTIENSQSSVAANVVRLELCAGVGQR